MISTNHNQNAAATPTNNGSQISLISSSDHVDYHTTIPDGDLIKLRIDSFTITGLHRDPVGTIATSWAVDTSGHQLPTRLYEVLPDDITRQYVDLRGASFPIVVDPT